MTKVYQPHETKICISCDNKLPANEKFFHRKKDNQDGLNKSCKKCKNNSEKLRLYMKRESLPLIHVSVANPQRYFIYRPDYSEIQVDILKGGVLAHVKPITAFEQSFIRKTIIPQ